MLRIYKRKSDYSWSPSACASQLPFVLEHVASLLSMFNVQFCLLSSPSFCVHSLTLKAALTTSPSLYVLIFRISVHLIRVNICCFFSNYTFTQPSFPTWYLFSSFVQRCSLVDQHWHLITKFKSIGAVCSSFTHHDTWQRWWAFPSSFLAPIQPSSMSDYSPCLYA